MSPGLGTSTWVTSGRFGIFECIYLEIKKMLSFCENPRILISGTSSNYIFVKRSHPYFSFLRSFSFLSSSAVFLFFSFVKTVECL